MRRVWRKKREKEKKGAEGIEKVIDKRIRLIEY